MKKFIIMGIAACVIALSASVTALAANKADGWRDFNAADLSCSYNKTGSAFCIVVGGVLDGWSVSAGNWGIDVENPNEKIVWKKKNSGFDRTNVTFPRNKWQYQNSGVACMRMTSTVGCMIREGKMEGFGFIVSGDYLEIYGMDSDRPLFKRGLAY